MDFSLFLRLYVFNLENRNVSLVIVFPFLGWRKHIIIVSVQKTRGELGCGYVCVCLCSKLNQGDYTH